MTMHIASQIVIPITSITALFLVACKNRWGFVIGITGQPFWFYATASQSQWGMFLTSIAATLCHMLGIWNWFFRNRPILQTTKG